MTERERLLASLRDLHPEQFLYGCKFAADQGYWTAITVSKLILEIEKDADMPAQIMKFFLVGAPVFIGSDTP